MKKVAIVIPYHRQVISKDEEISIRHLNKYLGKYDKFLVLPERFKQVSFNIPKSTVVHFPSEYFISVPKYCEMMNLKEFYLTFKDYQYILIYQLDVLVFSDQLKKWCNMGYDFIGAPFLKPFIGNLSSPKNNPKSGGNGGFSLRKVSSFLKVITEAEKEIERTSDNQNIRKLWFLLAVLSGQSHSKWLKAHPKDYPFNEDGFWSYEAPKYLKGYKVAPFDIALKFSFEKKPERCFIQNQYNLPFGCHAWAKYNKSFWEPYILKNHRNESI